MRIAIVSSPRSGNTWFRSLLADTLGFQQIAVHDWKEVGAAMPADCLLQIHWYREPGFQRFLKKNGFRVLTLARHPLDVLISVLRFMKFSKETHRWLEGNCTLHGLEAPQVGPADDAFLEWCLGFGCENLLSVTYQWAQDPDVAMVHYEALLTDVQKEVSRLLERDLKWSASLSEQTIQKYSIESFALPEKSPRVARQGRPMEAALLPRDGTAHL